MMKDMEELYQGQAILYSDGAGGRAGGSGAWV